MKMKMKMKTGIGEMPGIYLYKYVSGLTGPLSLISIAEIFPKDSQSFTIGPIRLSRN